MGQKFNELAARLATGAAARAGIKTAGEFIATIKDKKKLKLLLATGERLAKEGITAIRKAPDYDPAIWGTTDEEIAEKLLEKLDGN